MKYNKTFGAFVFGSLNITVLGLTNPDVNRNECCNCIMFKVMFKKTTIIVRFEIMEYYAHLLSFQPRMTVTSSFVNKVIRGGGANNRYITCVLILSAG